MASNRLVSNNNLRLCVAHAALASFCFLSSVGCSTQPDEECLLSLNGSPDSELIILSYDDNGRLAPADTILPADTIHTLRHELKDRLLAIQINEKPLFFIAEKGSVRIDCKHLTVKGTPLNEAKLAFEASINQMRSAASESFDSIASNSSLSVDDRKAELAQLSKRETRKLVAYAMDVVKNNGGNALAQYAFLFGVAKNRLVRVEEYAKLVASTSPNVSNFPPIRQISVANSNALATSPGSDFRDVDMLSADGSNVKLSDYVQRDAVNVIHVFDPYNQATPKTLALLWKIRKDIEAHHEKNGGNINSTPKLNVISVCEYSKEDIVNKIVKRFALDWIMLADPEAHFTELYGLQTMPFFIVVDEEGKIEERGVGEDALYNWVYTRIVVK